MQRAFNRGHQKGDGAGGPAGLDINPGLSVSLDSGNLNISGVFLNPSTGGSRKVRGSGLTGAHRSISY